MKIGIDIGDGYSDLEVKIGAPSLTPEVEKIVSLLRMMDLQLTARKGEEIHLLDMKDILYIEAVERTTFLYTEEEVFESDHKLYELEQQLNERGFLRVSKSTLIQLKKIKSLKAELNRRIRVTMKNGEQIVVSRMYAEELRRRLGVK